MKGYFINIKSLNLKLKGIIVFNNFHQLNLLFANSLESIISSQTHSIIPFAGLRGVNVRKIDYHLLVDCYRCSLVCSGSCCYCYCHNYCSCLYYCFHYSYPDICYRDFYLLHRCCLPKIYWPPKEVFAGHFLGVVYLI